MNHLLRYRAMLALRALLKPLVQSVREVLDVERCHDSSIMPPFRRRVNPMVLTAGTVARRSIHWESGLADHLKAAAFVATANPIVLTVETVPRRSIQRIRGLRSRWRTKFSQ